MRHPDIQIQVCDTPRRAQHHLGGILANSALPEPRGNGQMQARDIL